MSITDLHAAARSFAEAGIPVFPCLVNGKAPATENGFKDATTDLAQIDAWWAEADYNLALSPEMCGWCVVDTDMGIAPDGRQKNGESSWAELSALENVPDTYTVRTPGGGLHRYFKGSLGNSASKIGQDIDTRGRGGYVLVPPSVVNGKPYEVLHDRDIAPLPGWVAAAVGAAREKVKATVAERDLPGNIERAKHLVSTSLRNNDVAVSGRGGNDRTYRLCCELLNLGVSTDTARELLEPWNQNCIPPWSQDELDQILENASSYAQNEVGAWAVQPAATVFADVLDKLPVTTEQPAHRSRFYFEDDEEQDEGADRPDLIKDLIPEENTILLVGAKGSFKSFIAQEILLALAAKTNTFGVTPSRFGPTFFGAHEGLKKMKRQRKHAWKAERGVEGKIPFYIAPGPRVAFPDECEEFREQIRFRLRQGSEKIAAIALDTVAKCMAGLDENSARDAGIFVDFCDSLVREFECPVLALHHKGKNGMTRGSGAIEANFGTVIDIERAGKSKAVRVSVRYHKDGEEPETPWTFAAKTVGKALVFSPINGAEYHAAASEDDPFDRLKVGAALKELNAIGSDNAVTTNVLASELIQAVENEPIEKQLSDRAKAEGILRALAKKTLSAYCEGQGRALLWSLPSE